MFFTHDPKVEINQMNTLSLEALCKQSVTIAKQTGQFLLAELGKVNAHQIEEKSLNSLVSYVDQEAEKQIVAGLQALLPAAAFLTEEATVEQSEAAYRWIIDPLDGTTNFLFGLPCFAISIALEHQGQLVLGVVYEPNRDECFYAWQGGGAWCNEQPIHCRNNSDLKQSLLATGFPYYDYSRMQPYLKLFTQLAQNTRGIRRWGAAAVDLAYVAAGRYDGFFEYALNAWDVAAGIILVQEAGGKVCDFKGQANSLNNGEIVAAGHSFHPLLLEQVQTYM